MKRLVILLRFIGRMIIFSWPTVWFVAWWVWPPAPRSGWQIPANEWAHGFLSDNEHLLTEEYVRENGQARPTGNMRIWNVTSGHLQRSYQRETAFWRCNLAHHRFVIQRRSLPGKSVTYFVNWPHDLQQLQMLNPWTGEILFQDEPVHELHLSWCISHDLVAYVRENKEMQTPEVVWRDVTHRNVVKTFPGLAGPIDFARNGRRFLATRWSPQDPIAELVQIEVPSGVIKRSIKIATEANSRFAAQQSCNDDHLFNWSRGVFDWRTGKLAYALDRHGFLSTLSNNGRYLIVLTDDRREHKLQWVDLQQSAVEPRMTVVFAKGESGGGGLGHFGYQQSKWVGATSQAKPRWPFLEKVAWFKRWLPDQERTHFIIVDSDTGRVIAQGLDREPHCHSPNGRLLIMREMGTNRDLIWSVPLDTGFPLSLAIGVAASLPAFVLWPKVRRRWRNPPTAPQSMST